MFIFYRNQKITGFRALKQKPIGQTKKTTDSHCLFGGPLIYRIIYTDFRHQFFENSEKLYIYRFFKIIYIVISVVNFRNYYTFIYHFNDDLQFLFE